MTETVVYVEGVTVSFDGFKALNKLNFIMDEGELRVVIGPNGAGKTTLLDLICGKVRPMEGRVILGRNTDIRSLPEYQISRLGIGRKFQTPSIFQNLTVFENMELASCGNGRSVSSSLFGGLSAAARQNIFAALEQIGMVEQAEEKAGTLSHGAKQWLEIGMVMAQDPKLMLIDEPVAGMTKKETEKTARLLQAIARNHSVLVIEHDMEFVRQIARKVTVLHEGNVLCEGPFEKIQSDPRVVEIYLGRERKHDAVN
jgi:urea transport system ATP-binding protein